jgi:hypothetical protein
MSRYSDGENTTTLNAYIQICFPITVSDRCLLRIYFMCTGTWHTISTCESLTCFQSRFAQVSSLSLNKNNESSIKRFAHPFKENENNSMVIRRRCPLCNMFFELTRIRSSTTSPSLFFKWCQVTERNSFDWMSYFRRITPVMVCTYQRLQTKKTWHTDDRWQKYEHDWVLFFNSSTFYQLDFQRTCRQRLFMC